MFKNKKGGGEGIVYPVIIFVILNLIFFSMLLLFVNNSSKGSLIYEQFYAKQIALLVDEANPETIITIDFRKGAEIAKKNNLFLDQGVVSARNNEIFVKLSNEGGYGFKFFSDNRVDFRFNGENLIVIIREKNGD